MHLEKHYVIYWLFGLVAAQRHALSFKVPKTTHWLRATSQDFPNWLSTSTILGKVLGISKAKVSLVVGGFFNFTVLPNVLQSVTIRIMICPVNTILVSLVAKTTLGKKKKKTDPAAKTTNYCILS